MDITLDHKLDSLWKNFSESFNSLKLDISKSKSIHINEKKIKNKVIDFGKMYFREIQPLLNEISLHRQLIEALDSKIQDLIKYTSTRTKISEYKNTNKELSQLLMDVSLQIEISIGQYIKNLKKTNLNSEIEKNIINTLYQLVPSAALSYQQALQDLQTEGRISFRGTANELREALREILNHLAPDDKVIKQHGFVFEKGLSKPTMRQKVLFILNARKLPDSIIKVPETSIRLIDQYTATLARALYDRSSISSHISTSKNEIMTIKRYVDSLLCEILSI